MDEHSAVDPGPDSIPDPVRPDPADGVAVAAVQGAVREGLRNQRLLWGIEAPHTGQMVFKVRRVVDSAIAAGVTDRLWDVADLVAAWEASERREEKAAAQGTVIGFLGGADPRTRHHPKESFNSRESPTQTGECRFLYRLQMERPEMVGEFIANPSYSPTRRWRVGR